MPQIIMFWDRVDHFGDGISGMEITNNYYAIEIPADACGFRLGIPGEPWFDAWYFANPGQLGAVFQKGKVIYSSSYTGTPSMDAIEARGPVHGCSSGLYDFRTPLLKEGIGGDKPVFDGAGAFVAEFTSEDEIEWLDSAGKKLPKLPEFKPAKPPKLPEEFFEKLPTVRGCIRDFDGKLHCPKDADTAAMPSGPHSLTLAGALSLPGMAMLVASGSGILPQVKSISAPAGSVNAVPHSKVETNCPAELVLTATFFKKDHSVEPATVQYRFRFSHGPTSTVFSTLVDKEGENSVFHSVPIPLPRPVGQTPTGGGVASGPVQLTVFVKHEDPFPSGGGTAQATSTFVAEALPENEHKSSVCVEVLNAFEGIVASKFATYHLVCTEASTRPSLVPGARGAAVVALQSGLNRWLKARQMPILPVDGVFGTQTGKAIRAFQNEHSLSVNGTADLRTWSELLAFQRY